MSEQEGINMISELRAEKRKLVKVLYWIIGLLGVSFFGTYVTIMTTQAKLLVNQDNTIKTINSHTIRIGEITDKVDNLKDRVLTLEVRDGTLIVPQSVNYKLEDE